MPHALGYGVREVEGQRVSRPLRWFLRLVQAEPAESTPEQKRLVYDIVSDSYLGGPVCDVDVSNTILPGPVPVAIRFYRPKNVADEAPCILWIHGGGYVIGSLTSHDRFCRRLCEQTGAVVVALNYRLAPEHPYPAAHEDVEAVYSWLRCNASNLGIDGARIAVGGDSAGGGLTAALCQRLPVEERPRMQILCYPGTDLSKAWPSYEPWSNGYFLTRPVMRWFLNHYCPVESRTEARASPLLAPELTDQPTTLLVTAGMDPLQDEGLAYGDKLEASGTTVHRMHVGPMVHGFITLCGVLPRASDAVEEMAEKVARLLSQK